MCMNPFWHYLADPAQNGSPSNLWRYLVNPNEAPSIKVYEAEQSAPCALYFNEDLVFWAMRNLPVSDAPKHYLIAGAIGSAKTTTIRLFIQSIAPRFRRGRKYP